MAANYTETSWVSYGYNDSLSAVVFAGAAANGTKFDDDAASTVILATMEDTTYAPFENATRSSSSSWWTTSNSSLDYDLWKQIAENDDGFNLSLTELPFYRNVNDVAFNPYEELMTPELNDTLSSGVLPNDTFVLINTSDSTPAAFYGGSWPNGSQSYPVNETPLVDLGANATDGYVNTWNGYMYPSGHSVTHIAVTATIVTMIMIMVVVGNMLVIVAIVTERNLKTIQNWFIASLAVADFFLGLIVMPFSLAQELMGYWIFGYWWCEIYLAVDVLLCTSSIMNLCLISLDRYWSITQAVDYLKKRTESRGAVMIATVWILSFLISVPPLMGWKNFSQPKEIPICAVSEDSGYVIYSASGSFFIPSVIMVFVYVRIYFAARSRARRVVKKHRPTLDAAKDKSTTTTSFSNASPPDKGKNTLHHMPTTPSLHSVSKSNQLEVPPSTPISIIGTSPILTPKHDGVLPQFPPPIAEEVNGTSKEAKHLSPTNNSSEASQPLMADEKKHLRVQVVSSPSPLQRANTTGSSGRMFGHKANGSTSRSVHVKASPSRLVSQAHALAQAQAQILLADEMECLSELDHSSDSDSVNRDRKKVRGFRRLAILCNPPSRKSGSGHGTSSQADEIDLNRVPLKPRDPEREKRRIARKKERRATLILGLIMAAFILCWLPFFTLYLIRALCEDCRDASTEFSFAFWLGYCNSALNPIIYTIFNKDFRKAFRKILFK